MQGTPISTRSPNTAPLVALGCLGLLWGYNWVVMKIALRYCAPLDFAALRAAFGVLALFIIMRLLRVPLAPRQVGKTMLLGLFQTTGFVGLISISLSIGVAGKNAVLAYTMPFWVLLLGWPFISERLRPAQWPAVGMALVGLILVLELWESTAGLASNLLALGAGASWAVSVIVFKTMPINDRNDLLSVTSWQMLYGTVPLVALALIVPEPDISWTGEFLGALLYNILGGMAAATLLWQFILQRLPATISSLNSLVVPVVGLLSAWWQLGERPNLVEGIGVILIIAGLALLSMFGQERRPGERAARSLP